MSFVGQAPPGRDRGSGVVLVVALVAVVFTIALCLATTAAVRVNRARAELAADLAALAGAATLAVPHGVQLSAEAEQRADPCGRAGRVAQRNGAVLTSCHTAPGGVVEVEVRSGSAAARARAGPRLIRSDSA